MSNTPENHRNLLKKTLSVLLKLHLTIESSIFESFSVRSIRSVRFIAKTPARSERSIAR